MDNFFNPVRCNCCLTSVINMNIVKYTNTNIKGYNGKDIFVDVDFVPQLDLANEVLKEENMMMHVTSSGRWDTYVKGAIVKPAEKGNHLVFQALDFNLEDMITGVWYNSLKLGDGTGRDEVVMNKIADKAKLRFGKAFKTKDSVHLDSNLNHLNPALWQVKYKEAQALKPKK